MKRLAAAIASLALVAQTGCATILDDRIQRIPIRVVPSDAQVILDGNDMDISEGVLKVERTRNTQKLVVRKAGYETREVQLEQRMNASFIWNFATVLPTVLFGIGIVIDLVSGEAFEVTPESITVRLAPAAPPSAATSTTARVGG